MKNTQKSLAVLGAAALVATLAACSAPTLTPASTSSSASAASASDGAATTSADSSIVLPVDANPIANQATHPDLAVVSAAVEDLVDPATGQAIDDRLMLTLKNNGSVDLSNLEVYYTMTDAVTGASESYYQALTGFTLAAGAEDYVYFDNKTDPGHFPENQFSLFRSSVNQVDFTIMVSADLGGIAQATTFKSEGTGEKVD
jgi:hypothetical protein